MVENLLHLVKVYGFVLNGARAYYENRRFPTLHFCCLSHVYILDYLFYATSKICHPSDFLSIESTTGWILCANHFLKKIEFLPFKGH